MHVIKQMMYGARTIYSYNSGSNVCFNLFKVKFVLFNMKVDIIFAPLRIFCLDLDIAIFNLKEDIINYSIHADLCCTP